MDYRKHYRALVSRARLRGKPLNCYTERHHVKPKCLGGSNAKRNIAWLTAEEHFCAHLLLVKIHPYKRGLIFAAHAMTRDPHGHRVSNKRYGWLRRRYAEARAEARRGKTMTAHNKQRLREAAAKRRYKPLTKEHRAKISEGLRNSPRRKAFEQRHSEEMRGRKHSIRTRIKMHEAALRRWHG